MSVQDLTDQLQKGLRVALGATTSLVESLQDAQKREENLAKLRLDWDQLSEEWARKGEKTEQEARSFVDMMMNQAAKPTGSPAPGSTGTQNAPTTSPEIQKEIQELTAQIASMRSELEQLREQNPSA
jgi:polyhydroxyalkanoate synthesis regulator phasin